MNIKFAEILSNILGRHIEWVYDAPGTLYMTLTKKELDIFVEKIVKECAKIALGDSGLGDYKRARESAMADILNHFEIAKIENLKDRTWIE